MMLGFAIAPVAPVPAAPPVSPFVPQRAWGAALLRVLFWTATLKPLLQGVALVGMAAYWLVNNTRQGRQRYHLRAAWAALASLYVAPWTPWAWLALAAAFDAWHCWREPSRWISAREQRVLARGCALAAAWSVLALDVELPWTWIHVDAGLLTCDVPWSWGVPLWTPLAVAAAWPWSKERRIRPDVAPVEEIHPLVKQWQLEVATHPKAGPLAFTELRHDPATGRFHLRAPIDGDEGVEGASHRACRLMDRVSGTVTISPDPAGTSNDFLVALTEPNDAAVVRYLAPEDLDGIDRDGSFITADTADGRVIKGAVRGPSGAAHGQILAPTRYGKGFVMRQYGVALARWDKGFLNIADCKGEHEGGAGVPELRVGADVYGWTRDQWRACVEMHHELFSARASRYGRVGRNFYNPDALVDGYADPLLMLMIDEKRKLIRAWGNAILTKLEDMSSQGSSFGVGIIENTQKGDGASTGSTAFRNDIRGNGTIYIGRFEDAQAARDATQGFDVDVMKLPNAKGWWFIKSALHATPLVPARSRVLPTRDEVQFMGFDEPYGTVEDWLVGTKRAKLHPQDQEIVEKWREWFEDAPAPAAVEVEPQGDLVAEAVVKAAMDGMASGKLQQTQWFAEGDPTWRAWMTAGCPMTDDGPDLSGIALSGEATEPAPGVHVEAAPRLHLVPAQAGSRTARELIPDVLRTAGRALTRGEIADMIGQSPTYVSGLLAEMEGQAVKRATTPDGKPGWTVAA